jgi:hypothetical protein
MVLRLALMAGLLMSVPAMASEGASALEVRAAQAFSSGDYATALPMLQRLSEQLKDQPDRLGQVQEQIRVARAGLAQAQPDAQAAASERGLAEADPPQTAEQRKAHTKPEAGQAYEVSIKELGNFEYDADNGGNIPEDVQALSGSNLRIRGFMIPLDQADRITEFALVADLFACCFGQPPQLQHTVVVRTPQGKAVSYFDDEIVVEGKLTVEEKREDDWIVSIFEMEAASVKPAPR